MMEKEKQFIPQLRFPNFQGKWEKVIISKIANKISSYVKSSGIPVRTGGDEFLILLNLTDVSNRQKVLEKICSKINKIIAILEDGDLLKDMPNTQGSDSFYCMQDLIKMLRKKILVEEGLSLPSFDNVDCLKQIFLSSKIVEHYNPQSIDYFMLDMDFFAPYELWDKKGEKYEEMSETDKAARKKIIQKHVKFIISNILIDASTANYYQIGSYSVDYISKMMWIINRTAHFCGKKSSSFVKDHVKIITFNYESMFERQLLNRVSHDNSNYLLKNTTAVYGKIILEDNLGGKISEVTEDSLWQSIFLSKGEDYFIKFPDGVTLDNKYSSCKDVFGQLSKLIKWIGESESEEEKKDMEVDRNRMIEDFNKATDIYFLGFGFDLNNLYQIGLIDKNNNLKIKNDRKRKFYVSGGDAKIINTIKTIFELEEQQIITTSRLVEVDDPNCTKKKEGEIPKIPIQLTNHLYRLVSKDKNIEFIVSDKMLPEALDDFGT